jgi:hypothetical protein
VDKHFTRIRLEWRCGKPSVPTDKLRYVVGDTDSIPCTVNGFVCEWSRPISRVVSTRFPEAPKAPRPRKPGRLPETRGMPVEAELILHLLLQTRLHLMLLLDVFSPAAPHRLRALATRGIFNADGKP